MKIPEGWPTEEMIKAGLGAFWDAYGSNISQIAGPLEKAFEAMLAAAPTPPAQEDKPVAWKISVQRAYGYLWHVNELQGVPAPEYQPSKAAIEARKALRGLLSHEELGEGINMVREIVYAGHPYPPPPPDER